LNSQGIYFVVCRPERGGLPTYFPCGRCSRGTRPSLFVFKKTKDGSDQNNQIIFLEKVIPPIKYILYGRKSTDSEDRQLLSLNDQLEELEKVEKREELTVTEKFGGDERGEKRTAHKRGRPIFNYVMDQIEAGKANGLLVWHANRLSRNAFDGGWIVTAMDEGKLIEVKTPHRVYRNNPDDKFALQIEFSMAKKTSDDTGMAIKRRLDKKIEDGWFPSRAPLGWLNTKKPEGDNYIIEDPERFEKIQQVLSWLLSGVYTPKQVMEKGNNELGLKTRPTKRYPSKPVSRSKYYALFRAPFLYGWFEWPEGSGILHKGNHRPMITEEEFDRIQVLLDKKGSPRPRKHRFIFTGLISCGFCGAMITAEEHTKRQLNGNVHHYIYYRCTKKLDPRCPEKYVESKELVNQIDDVLAGITVSDDFVSYGIEYYNHIRHTEARTKIKALETKQRALVEVNKQLSNLMLKFTSPENTNGQFFTDQEYHELKARLLKEKSSLERDLDQQGKGIEEWMELSEKTFQFARYAREWFKKGGPEVKKAILVGLGSNLTLKDQKLAITLHKPYKSISYSLYESQAEIAEARTFVYGVNKIRFNDLFTRCPVSRWVWDDVRTYFQQENTDFPIPAFTEDSSGQLKLAA